MSICHIYIKEPVNSAQLLSLNTPTKSASHTVTGVAKSLSCWSFNWKTASDWITNLKIFLLFFGGRFPSPPCPASNPIAPFQMFMPPDNFAFCYSFLLVLFYSAIYFLIIWFFQCSHHLKCGRWSCRWLKHRWCSLLWWLMAVSDFVMKGLEVACIATLGYIVHPPLRI